jgi:hypothetical protein
VLQLIKAIINIGERRNSPLWKKGRKVVKYEILMGRTVEKQKRMTLWKKRKELGLAGGFADPWLATSSSHDQHFEGELPRKKATSDCYLIERIWKLLIKIDDLQLLMDPDDFLRLKNQLCLKLLSEMALFCFRSRGRSAKT